MFFLSGSSGRGRRQCALVAFADVPLVFLDEVVSSVTAEFSRERFAKDNSAAEPMFRAEKQKFSPGYRNSKKIDKIGNPIGRFNRFNPRYRLIRSIRSRSKTTLLVVENIEKTECLGNWNKNDLIRQVYIAVGDEIVDVSGSDGECI